MAIYSSGFAWRLLRTEEPGMLQSMGSPRVRHDWVTDHTHTHIYTFARKIESLWWYCNN